MNRYHLKLVAAPMSSWTARGIILLAAVVFLGACSSKRPLMPTPDVYSLGIKHPFAETLPAELKTVDMNIMYVTDRVPDSREDGRLDYSLAELLPWRLARRS